VRRAARRDPGEEGQALLEFVLAFPLVVFLVVAVLEFSHYANVVQLAQYAAFAAARAQIVHGRDEAPAAKAAALAMAPFAESGTERYGSVPKDGSAASAAESVAGTLAELTADGKAYASGRLHGQRERVLNSFRWQTRTWMGYYGADDKPVSQTNSPYAYVKSGVCFTYPLRVQSLAPLAAWVVRQRDRKPGDEKASSLFGGATTNSMTPPSSVDWWARAERISSACSLTCIPVVQGCILGR